MEDETDGEFNLQEAANEIIADGDSGSDSVEDSSQSEGQSVTDSQKTEGNKELGPEEILKQVSEQKEDPAQFAELLRAVNQLGAIGNGVPINVDSPEKLKQLLEMGSGFYAKTEEHANFVKTKEAEYLQKDTDFKQREEQFTQREIQLDTTVTQHQNIMAIVERLQTEDPELFEHFDKLYIAQEKAAEKENSYARKFQGELKARDEKIDSLSKKIDQKENTEIRNGWEKGFSDLQTKYATTFSKLGLNLSEQKVRAIWAADSANKMTPEEAMDAAYGADMRKALTSFNKLLQTKTKTQASLLGRSAVGRGQRGAEETKEYASGDYEGILRDGAKNL
jgi:hypothetical protein